MVVVGNHYDRLFGPSDRFVPTHFSDENSYRCARIHSSQNIDRRRKQVLSTLPPLITPLSSTMPPKESLSNTQEGSVDPSAEMEGEVVKPPAARSVAQYDTVEDIKSALNQVNIYDESSPDWFLQNYDRESTVTRPNKVDDEAFRLSVLKSYNILDSEKEVEFEEITNECKRRFNCPIAVVSLVDMGRQWFKSIQGLPVESTPRCVAFCAHVVKRKSHTVMVVPDATKDDRFKENPLVTGGPRIRFYAGAPIFTPEGAKIGSLCVIDTKPHPDGLAPEEEDQLMALSQEVAYYLITRSEVSSPKR